MTKRLLPLSLLLLTTSLLPALEIYLNGKLWEHYPPEELAEMGMPAEPQRRGMGTELPLRELLPLMARWESLKIRIPGGEVLLEGEELARRLNDSVLQVSPDGSGRLFSGEDLYSDPSQLRLRGVPDEAESLTLWAEPGLERYKPLLDFWAAAHKIELIYRETEELSEEIIHRKMLGDPLPDFTLRGLRPSEPLLREEVLSYRLESALCRGDRGPLRLILPRGEKVHPGFFFSLLAAGEEEPGSPASLKEAARLYTKLIAQGVLVEKVPGLLSREASVRQAFFPAEAHREQEGRLGPIPLVPGLLNRPAGRVLPILLEGSGPAHREEALRAYLLHPGVQRSLFDPEGRHLPARAEGRDGSVQAAQLEEELRKGYVLYEENYPLWERVRDNLPALLLEYAAGEGYE